MPSSECFSKCFPRVKKFDDRYPASSIYDFAPARQTAILPLSFLYFFFMQLSPEQVKHIAKLARLGLSDEEVKKFSTQLTDILEYIKILDEVDTTNVESTSQVTGLGNILREDVVDREWVKREELLACSELPVEEDQIRVKPVIE